MYESELERLKSEKEQIKQDLKTKQLQFAYEMKNGIGNDIINGIKTPPKPTSSKKFFNKIKVFFKRLIEIC